MSSKRIVTIEDITGNVLAEWAGGQEQSLPDPPAGRSHRDVTASPRTSHSGLRWTGNTFVPIPPTPATPTQLDRIESVLVRLEGRPGA
jgi:hypothetical protein